MIVKKAGKTIVKASKVMTEEQREEYFDGIRMKERKTRKRETAAKRTTRKKKKSIGMNKK